MLGKPNRSTWHSRRLRVESLENRRLLALTVDTLVDEADGSVTDGDISLRDAVALAAPGETIDFAVTGTIALDHSLGQVFIERPLTIDGGNAITIDGGHGPDGVFNTGDGHRLFIVSAIGNAEVTLAGLVLRGGDVDGRGGAILSGENLTLRDTHLTANAATRQGGALSLSAGTTNVIGSTFSDNRSGFRGGAAHQQAGTVANFYQSTFSGNQAQAVGAIAVDGGSATIEQTTVTANAATGFVGGILASGSVRMTESIVAGNTAGITDDDIAGTGLVGIRNFIGGDPELGPLQDNGGPTPTHAPLPGSPVIDGGVSPVVTSAFGFVDSLFSAIPGPTLTAFPEEAPLVFTPGELEVPESLGLRLDGAIENAEAYSIELQIRFDSLSSGYEKLIDFSNLTSDAGLYTRNGRLVFWDDVRNEPIDGTTPLVVGDFYRVLFTRDLAGVVRVFLNEQAEISFEDGVDRQTVLDEPDRAVWLFADDASTLGTEEGVFRLDVLRTANRAVTPVEILNAVDADQLPTNDQRGVGYPRAVAGPGGFRTDLGAVEFQGIRTLTQGDYNGDLRVDAADYTLWRDTLGQPSKASLGADGNGNGEIDEADYWFWRRRYGTVIDPPESSRVDDSQQGTEFETIDGVFITSDAWERETQLPQRLESASSSDGLARMRALLLVDTFATLAADESASSTPSEHGTEPDRNEAIEEAFATDWEL